MDSDPGVWRGEGGWMCGGKEDEHQGAPSINNGDGGEQEE